jgi:hypothetical protein
VGPIGSPETPVHNQTKLRNIPEDGKIDVRIALYQLTFLTEIRCFFCAVRIESIGTANIGILVQRACDSNSDPKVVTLIEISIRYS